MNPEAEHTHIMEDKWWPYAAREGRNKPKQWRQCVLPKCKFFETRELD